MWDREQYEAWFVILRCGRRELAELDERQADETERGLVALNIQIAWFHLREPDSPYRQVLTDTDQRTIQIAQAINDDTPVTVVM